MPFVSPLLLIAAGAVALPILAHLARQRKARNVPFSSLMFLEASPLPVVRKRRLKDMLLLILRCVMLALLAVAFARPFIPREQLPFIPERQSQSIIILMDQSLSIQASDRLEEARASALRHLDETSAGDEVAIVAFNDAAVQQTALGRDMELHRRAVASVQPTFRTTDYRAPLRMASDILQQARHEQKRIVLISDFQFNGFSPNLEDYPLVEGTEFVTEPVGVNTQENLFFEDMDITLHRSADSVALTLRARLASDRGNPVRLVLSGMPDDERATTPSGQVHFQQRSVRTGYHQGSFHLDDPVLEADNIHYFTTYVAPRPVVTVVDRDPDERNAFYLRTAFELEEHAAFTFHERRRLSTSAVRDVNIVILPDLPTLLPDEVQILRRFVEGGGGAIVAAGPRTDRVALASALHDLGVITATPFTVRTSEPTRPFTLGEYEDHHAGLGSMLDHTARVRPRIHTYAVMEPDSGASTIAQLNSGDPLVIEKRVGAGRILAFTTSLGSQWNDLPLGGAYVPLLHSLATYSFDAPSSSHQYTVGDAVSIPDDIQWDILAPDGKVFKVDTGYFRNTEVPGHYIAESQTDQRMFSVNIDPLESDLTARDQEEVYAAIKGPQDDYARTPNEASHAIREEERDQKMWRIVILAVVGIFILENLIAGRSKWKEAHNAGQS